MKLKCPYCPKELAVLKSSAGAVERCPACGSMVRLPAEGETEIQPVQSPAEAKAARPPESPIVAARREQEAIEAESHWSRFSWPVKIVLALSAASIFVVPRVLNVLNGGSGRNAPLKNFNDTLAETDRLMHERIEELDACVGAFVKNRESAPDPGPSLQSARNQLQASRSVLLHLAVPDDPGARRFSAAAGDLLAVDDRLIEAGYAPLVAAAREPGGPPEDKLALLVEEVLSLRRIESDRREVVRRAQQDFAAAHGITLR